MAMTAMGSRGARSAINVTPLIDVLLVLLIIFMVIQPSVERGLEATVPRPPRQHDIAPDPRTVVITVRGSSKAPVYAVNQQQVTLPELPELLQRLAQRGGAFALFVQGERDLDYAAVAPVFNAVQAAGVSQVGVLTPASLTAF